MGIFFKKSLLRTFPLNKDHFFDTANPYQTSKDLMDRRLLEKKKKGKRKKEKEEKQKNENGKRKKGKVRQA